jgi:cysteinyl-tRNA synthetase
MAYHYLGPSLDIHGGGNDLIYPHHANEIAQSETATGHVPFARYWLHPAMVQLYGIKMSKSLGNLVFARDLLARHGAAAIRHYLLSTHYRAQLDYSEGALAQSERRIDLLERAISRAHPTGEGDLFDEDTQRFDAAMDNDLDTPTALEVIDGTVERILHSPGSVRSRDGVEAVHRMAVRLGLVRPSQ